MNFYICVIWNIWCKIFTFSSKQVPNQQGDVWYAFDSPISPPKSKENCLILKTSFVDVLKYLALYIPHTLLFTTHLNIPCCIDTRRQIHFTDVIMSVMASQITSLTIVYSTVYSGAYQRTNQSFMSLAFVRGIPLSPVNSPHKRPVTRKMFPFDDVIIYYRILKSYKSSRYCISRTYMLMISTDLQPRKKINCKQIYCIHIHGDKLHAILFKLVYSSIYL